MWLLLPGAARATNWVVPADGTLPEVYAAADHGDSIELPGLVVTDELPALDKRLTIFGQGVGTTVLELPDREPSVYVRADTTFRALTLDGRDLHQMLELPVATTVLTLTDVVLEGGVTNDHGGCVQAWNQTQVHAVDTAFRGCRGVQGGAVSAINATFTCERCVFEGNRATSGFGAGGAVWLDGSTGTFTDSDFRLNEAESASGGAIGLVASASVTVYGGTFDGNLAEDRGGAISGRSGNAITVLPSAIGGTSFRNGRALDGGALACELYTPCHLTVDGASFADHTVDGRGGHVFVESGTAIVSDSTFARGHAGGRGGALFIGAPGSVLTVSDSVFEANDSGEQGGGLFATSTTVDLLRTALCDNVAADSGGGAYFELGPSTLVRNCTAIRNIAVDSGGGLRLNGSATVRQSTLVQNGAGTTGSAIGVRGNAAVVDVYGSVFSENDGSVAVDTSPDAVAPRATVDRSATWMNPGGDYGVNVAPNDGVGLSTDPFPSLPTTCGTAIPQLGGELTDLGGLLDLDGTVSDLGATGGPDADPDLWLSDGDPVPAMWDCEPTSSLAFPGNVEVPGDGIDNDCVGGDEPLGSTTEPLDDTAVDEVPGATDDEPLPVRPRTSAETSLPAATGCGCATPGTGGGWFLAVVLAGWRGRARGRGIQPTRRR